MADLPIPIEPPRLTDAVILGFNYDGMPQGLTGELKRGAARIRELVGEHVRSIVETGEILISARNKLANKGQFLAWAEVECGVLPRTAQRFMLVAEMMAGRHVSVTCLESTALYQLAAPSTPSEVRREVFERVAAGETVRLAQIKKKIDEAKGELAAKKREAEAAEREAKVSPRTRKARQEREAEYERERQEAEAAREAARAAGELVAEILLSRLEPEDRESLVELFGTRSYDMTVSHHFARAIVDALLTGLKAEPVEDAVVSEGALDEPAPVIDVVAVAADVVAELSPPPSSESTAQEALLAPTPTPEPGQAAVPPPGSSATPTPEPADGETWVGRKPPVPLPCAAKDGVCGYIKCAERGGCLMRPAQAAA